jgi:glycosyltransferase involved in cell wall biosynthesis
MRAVSLIITAHNEGKLVVNALNSILQNLRRVDIHEYEILIGLDDPDQVTKSILNQNDFDSNFITIHNFNLKDVGLVRQNLLNLSKFEYISFLDADDIWGDDWLYEAKKFYEKYPNAVLHPELTLFFDEKIKYVRKNPDSTSRKFKKELLLFENVWTSSFITPRWVMEKFPMKSGSTSDESSPYAYEDWSWFRETLAAGIEHRVVKKTAHFHKIKDSSNTSKSILLNKKPWPIVLKKLLF